MTIEMGGLSILRVDINDRVTGTNVKASSTQNLNRVTR